MGEGHQPIPSYIDVHWSVGVLFWILILIGVVLFIKSIFGSGSKGSGPKKE